MRKKLPIAGLHDAERGLLTNFDKFPAIFGEGRTSFNDDVGSEVVDAHLIRFTQVSVEVGNALFCHQHERSQILEHSLSTNHRTISNDIKCTYL